MLWLKFVILSAVALGGCVFCNTLCAFSKKDNVKYKRVDTALEDETYAQHSVAGHIVDANNTEHCSKDSDSCYALWQEDPTNKSIVILTQGCWDSSGDVNCGFSECIANKKPPKALNNTKFCCCSGNLCNLNVTDGYVNPIPEQNEDLNPALQYVEPLAYTSTVVVIAVAAMTVFVVLVLVMYYLFRFYFHPPKRSKESLHLIESATPPTPMFDSENLKIQETIGRGRYGTVCRGTLHDHAVAVKMFSHQNKQYFFNERDIYTLPAMEHPSILKFIGSEERIGVDGRPEYLLVLSYSPIGCLQDYLRSTTIDWSRLYKMSSSIARGLAHLHTECGKNEKSKPCVAHRDLTSRNILMKADGSCMLCDFGFAIRISGSKYYVNGEEQVAETTSLPDVGTLRYMAPEILEGAVNLRDCESSLKQIDVYALGLVLWEMATRCLDLFQGVEVPDYKLPFEAEVGAHPTMEQMQVLVTRHKARPLFPDIWKDTNPAVRTLKETIEECWDQDAEARLTTLCVEERLAELPALWERHKMGLSTAACVDPANINKTSEMRVSVSSSKQQCNGDHAVGCELSNREETSPSVPRERAHSLSEGTTETLLSPSEPGSKDVSVGGIYKNSIANNILVTASKVSFPLQPHQGRNPCLERNLMLEPVDEVAVSGNTLLDPKSKLKVDRNFLSLSEGDASVFDSPMLDSSSLVSNDLLSHSTQLCSPILHQLNTVHGALVIPKQPNVPNSCFGNHDFSKSKDKRWSPLNIFDRRKARTRDGTREGIRAGLKSLLERKSANTNNKSLSEEQQPLKGPLGNSCSPCTPGTFDGNCGQTNIVNYIWNSDEDKVSDQIVDTEVRILNSDHSSTVVRPVNNAQISSKDERNAFCTEGVANGLATVVKSCPNNVVTDAASYFNSEVQNDAKTSEKSKRPNSLPLREFKNEYIDDTVVAENEVENIECQKDERNFVPIRRKNGSGKRKGVKRVKTPFEIKGRFSLYDDRIMSSQELSAVYSKEPVPPVLGKTTKFSTSVPLDMNALCSSEVLNLGTQGEHTESKLENKSRDSFRAPPNQLQIIGSLCDI